MSAKASNTVELRTGEVLDAEEFKSAHFQLLSFLKASEHHRYLFQKICLIARSPGKNSITTSTGTTEGNFEKAACCNLDDQGLVSIEKGPSGKTSIILSETLQKVALAMSELNGENIEAVSPIKESTDGETDFAPQDSVVVEGQ